MNKKFLMKEGSLDIYCHNQKISIKSFESADKLNTAISEKYTEEEKEMAGMFWFVRKDTKPKDTLRHLRNAFAHGNFQKRQKNKKQCLVIENIDSGRVKAKGFLPIDKLKGLIGVASGCGV